MVVGAFCRVSPFVTLTAGGDSPFIKSRAEVAQDWIKRSSFPTNGNGRENVSEWVCCVLLLLLLFELSEERDLN